MKAEGEEVVLEDLDPGMGYAVAVASHGTSGAGEYSNKTTVDCEWVWVWGVNMVFV